MIKYFIDKTNYLPIDSGMTHHLDVFYQKTELILEDDFIKLIAEDKQIDSQTYSSKFYRNEHFDDHYITLQIKADPVKRIYTRQVGSLLEFLGDIGGLIEIVFITVAGIMTYVIDRKFKAEIITDMYKVQKYSRDISEYYESNTAFENKKKHEITSESSDSDFDKKKDKEMSGSSSSSSFSS